MNNNFEIMIRNALKNGQSMESIASAFADCLNKVQAEDSPQQFYDEVEQDFWDAIDEEEFALENVAQLALLVACDDHDWSKEQMEVYMEVVKDILETAMALVDAMGDEGSFLGAVLNRLDRALEGKDVEVSVGTVDPKVIDFMKHFKR